MKKTLLLLSFFLPAFLVSAQLNVTYVGNLAYDEDLNDIWGYQAPDGTEYALVGVLNGFSIVSLADAANPTEVAFIPGDNSIWRDIKVWGDYAYVTTDQGDDGLLVVDMTNLPNSVEHYFWKPDLLGTGALRTCHNIYLDEFGYIYLSGCNINDGGILFIDVFTDPYNPNFVGAGDNRYAHDVYVRNNIMYTSDLTQGLNITDVTDKINYQLLATQATPFNFTHNAWSTDNNEFVFTTDEVADAPVASYDVSDPSNVIELDQFLPSNTIGDGVVPHNVHVWEEFLIISYYSDGVIIVDASNPANLIEVGNFDTFIPATTGFNGAWGAYPYLPSGKILVSDISSGLYVLEPNYVNASYLEGTVTDADDGSNLNNVVVKISSTEPNFADTDVLGKYKTGQASAGTFDVTFSKTGYEPLTVPANLVTGEVTILDVQLTKLIPLTISGTAISAVDGSPIADAQFIIKSDAIIYTATANADGDFTESVFEDTYEIIIGAWGYLHKVETQQISMTGNNEFVFELEEGYQDDFIFDFNWLSFGEATAGKWEKGEPEGTGFQGSASNTNTDITGDLGEECYVTGNDGGNAGNDDVDGGETNLRSPYMDLSGYNEPMLSYYTWFFNAGGGAQSGPPNDSLIIKVQNSMGDIATLETITDSEGAWRPQSEFNLADFIDISVPVRILITAGDYGGGHIVEAAVDAILVTEGMPTSIDNITRTNLSLKAFPNPFDENLTIEFDKNHNFSEAQLNVYNLLGQNIKSIVLPENNNSIQLNADWNAGIYFITIEMQGQVSETLRVVKN